MDYNKQQWVQRQRQQEVEKPRKVYTIDHDTYFTRRDKDGDYVAIVEVYSKHSIITLYKGSPSVKVLWFELTMEPICNPIQIGNKDSVHHTIKSMVEEYEMPLYMQYCAEELQGKLDIDYAEVLRKKRQRQLINIDREAAQEATVTATYEPPTISGLVYDADLTPEQKREQQIQEVAARTGKSEESLRNLLPFQTKKSS